MKKLILITAVLISGILTAQKLDHFMGGTKVDLIKRYEGTAGTTISKMIQVDGKWGISVSNKSAGFKALYIFQEKAVIIASIISIEERNERLYNPLFKDLQYHWVKLDQGNLWVFNHWGERWYVEASFIKGEYVLSYSITKGQL